MIKGIDSIDGAIRYMEERGYFPVITDMIEAASKISEADEEEIRKKQQ